MTRNRRHDAPGGIYHVTSRGIGARTIFESDDDRRYFLALVARAVRRGEIDVLAFCILHTHFHLIIRSRGEMSRALQRIKWSYARYFNRTRGGRTGTAYDGRYFSKPITCPVYEYVVLSYVDENAIKAGLVARPEDWRWCSAWLIARGRRPGWLDATWVDARVPEYSRRALPAERVRRARDLSVEAWLSSTAEVVVPVNLFLSDARGALAWMTERAVRADGGHPGGPVLAASGAMDALRDAMEVQPPPLIRDGAGRQTDLTRPVIAFVLRELCGASMAEVGAHLGRSRCAGRDAIQKHRRLVQTDTGYRAWSFELARRCLEQVLLPPGASSSGG